MELPEISCSEIIESIQDKLPALFFVFSRGRTEILAHDLGREWDFLNDREKKTVESEIRKQKRNTRNLQRSGLAQLEAPDAAGHRLPPRRAAAAGKIPGGKTIFKTLALGNFLHGNICGRR